MAGVIPPEDEDFELILVFPSGYGMIFGSIVVDEQGTEAPPSDAMGLNRSSLSQCSIYYRQVVVETLLLFGIFLLLFVIYFI